MLVVVQVQVQVPLLVVLCLYRSPHQRLQSVYHQQR
jgi:hypothetical protein